MNSFMCSISLQLRFVVNTFENMGASVYHKCLFGQLLYKCKFRAKTHAGVCEIRFENVSESVRAFASQTMQKT